jgi:AcrR family transcriptional regulator
LACRVRSPAPRTAPAKVGQRERLIEAMTQTAARYGYNDASVARVVEQAGVSRATFYEHFADKEECFLVAFRQAAERIELALERIEVDCAPARRAAEILDELLDNMASGPAAARILLVEALAGGPEVRRAHEQLMLTVETRLERWLAVEDNGIRLEISGRAVMEGIGGILVRRVFRGETAQLGDLRNDLLAWISAYTVPTDRPRLDPVQWRQLGTGLVEAFAAEIGTEGEAIKPLAGKGATASEATAGDQRERILGTVAQLTRTKGYTAMTVADIVKGAAVTRETFYEMFRSKEDAFLATQIGGLENAISLTAAGFFPGESWPVRVWGGLEALLRHVTLQPDLVYLDVIEAYSAGAAAIRRSFDNRIAYHLFLEDGYRQNPVAEGLPRLCSEAIGSAILGLSRWEVGEGRTERMLEILPQAVYLALAPFIGPAAAIELVEAKVAAEVPPT